MSSNAPFSWIDWCVLLLYFGGVMWIGFHFWRRNNSVDQFTAGGRSLPGWLCGLSIFATYLSSISYFAIPGKAYVGNWNVFMFSLSLPIAAWIAVRYFVPIYRRSGEVSAYSLLEKRFGLWARLYVSLLFLMLQVARIGVVMYLMALPMAVIFGWDIRVLIVVTGFVVTAYSFIGGIVAVVYADAIQAVVLTIGACLALAILMFQMPDGPVSAISLASAEDKFSLGDWSLTNLSKPTLWVVLAYGFFENLRNFGIDQSYVQRYIASQSDSEAAKSVWVGALLYVPVSALFLFIGSCLYSFYQTHPADLQEVRNLVARQQLMQASVSPDAPDYAMKFEATVELVKDENLGDRVFPHFITTYLPVGARGLLIAAVFAAAMSTVSTSLNSSATLVMSDFYQRLTRHEVSDAQQVIVLRLATIAWGVMGTAMAIVLAQKSDSILDVWWNISSVLGATTIGLFLIGILFPRLGNPSAIFITAIGALLISWMVVSPTSAWPDYLYKNPMHEWMTIVMGMVTMLALGFGFSVFGRARS